MIERDGDEHAGAAETIAETLQAFVDERRALEADRDDWRARAIHAETQAAEQLEVVQPDPPAIRRRLRGNWLSENW